MMTKIRQAKHCIPFGAYHVDAAALQAARATSPKGEYHSAA